MFNVGFQKKKLTRNYEIGRTGSALHGTEACRTLGVGDAQGLAGSVT